jgi:hypothetical protein
MDARREATMTQTPNETDLPAGLSNPARRALGTIGITRLDQLTEHRANDILNLHGMGPKGIRILREALAERGKAFAGDA